MFTVTFALQLWTYGKPNFLTLFDKKVSIPTGLQSMWTKNGLFISEKAER